MIDLRVAAAVCVLGAIPLGGCAEPDEAPPPPPATTMAAPSITLPPPPTATPTATATVDPSATPPLREPRPVRVTGIEVTGNTDSFEVRGRLVDHTGAPIIGAVGDFYVEGSAGNLVQSYATDVDGTFEASFTAAEVPPGSDLMLHYRGDDANAPGSFLIREGAAPSGDAGSRAPATRSPAATRPSAGTSTARTTTRTDAAAGDTSAPSTAGNAGPTARSAPEPTSAAPLPGDRSTD